MSLPKRFSGIPRKAIKLILTDEMFWKIHDHDTKVPEDIDDMIVDLYNEYRKRVRDGASLEECLPLFEEAAEKIVGSLDLEV